jgi:HTH-type transcriptional regulator / antitoxin HipB
MMQKNIALEKHVKIDSASDLGDFIKDFRSSQRLTQGDVSGLANTGNRFIIELENGKETVQLNKVLDVLNVLGLELTVARKSKF